MKSVRTLITLSLLLTASTLFAQTENRLLVKSTIPFNFTVEDQTMAAGEYLIYTVTPQRSIRIVSADGSHAATVNTMPDYASSPAERSTLTFQRYGSEYFLVQVRVANQNVARAPIATRRQAELARSGESYEKVTVLALAGQ